MLAILRCEQSQLNKLIKFNYYTSKSSINTTEMNGNVTFIVQLNDSLNGEYKVKMLAILQCDAIKSKNLMKLNFYLSKTSINTTEVKGNATYYVPLDDSLNIEINLAVKDSIGGWKDNAHMFKTPKACSSFRNLYGSSWTTVAKSLGMHNIQSCPIPAGCYVASDMDPNAPLFNLPKQFFYGTYKFRFQFTKNNEVYGCITSVIEVKRPWEND